MNFYEKQNQHRERVPYTRFVRNRNQKLEQAFQAIEDARRLLEELERLTVRAAEGQLPDIGQTAHLTHGLRDSVDRILVGIVESAVGPEGTSEREAA